MMYPDDATIRTHLTELLSNIAPDFELMHYSADTMHHHLHANVCARHGELRLMFDAQVYNNFATAGRFNYIGKDADSEGEHHTGISTHAKILIDAYPDAHVEFYDNEEDGHSSLFGYVAYDDDFRPLAWCPVPVEDEDENPYDEPPVIAHTLPDLDECMNYFRSEHYRKTNRGI